MKQGHKQAEAAVKIQSGYRGYQARKKVRTIREERAMQLEVSIVKA